MRTTLDIDDDVLAAAKEIARARRLSAGRVVSMLLREALLAPPLDRGDQGPPSVSAGGFRPFPSRGQPVTNAQVNRIRDEEGV